MVGFAHVVQMSSLAGLAKGRMDTMIWTEDWPSAICAVSGGCPVGSGGNVFKVTDPAGSGPDRQVTKVLLVAMPERVSSLGADQDRLILYLATAGATFAWIEGRVVPVLPFGGGLALNGDTVSLCSPGGGKGHPLQVPSRPQIVPEGHGRPSDR